MSFFDKQKCYEQSSCACKEAIGDKISEEDLVQHFGGGP